MYREKPDGWIQLVGVAHVPHSKLQLRAEKIHLFCLHPWRLTWNIIMEVSKIIFLSKWVIRRFHVNLPGCRFSSWKSPWNEPPKKSRDSIKINGKNEGLRGSPDVKRIFELLFSSGFFQPFLGGGNSSIWYFHHDNWERLIHFDEHIFQSGLKPPTSSFLFCQTVCQYSFCWTLCRFSKAIHRLTFWIVIFSNQQVCIYIYRLNIIYLNYTYIYINYTYIYIYRYVCMYESSNVCIYLIAKKNSTFLSFFHPWCSLRYNHHPWDFLPLVGSSGADSGTALLVTGDQVRWATSSCFGTVGPFPSVPSKNRLKMKKTDQILT